MATARNKSGRFVKSTSASGGRRRASGGAKAPKRRRTSYKNRSIAGDIESLGMLGGLVVSPLGQKSIQAVKSRSLKGMTSWTKDEVIKTGLYTLGGKVGGKFAGKVLNKVKPVKVGINSAKKFVKGLV